MKFLFVIFVLFGSFIGHAKNDTNTNGIDTRSYIKKKSCQSDGVKIFNIGKVFSKYSAKVLFCQPKNKENDNEISLSAYVLFFHQGVLAKDITLDNYLPEGNKPNIETVFLNDNHFKNELIILVSWKQRIKYTAEGKLFQVYVYHFKEQKHKIMVDKLDDLFDIGFEGVQEGKIIKWAYRTKDNIRKEITKMSNLKHFSEKVKNKKINVTLSSIKELLYYNEMSPKNLTTYNNIAYYLQKAGANKEAIYLLEKIIKKFPNRTVAYYNIGDAYWELGEKEKARKAYSTYIEQMCHKGLQKKIPKKVLQRVENK